MVSTCTDHANEASTNLVSVPIHSDAQNKYPRFERFTALLARAGSPACWKAVQCTQPCTREPRIQCADPQYKLETGSTSSGLVVFRASISTLLTVIAAYTSFHRRTRYSRSLLLRWLILAMKTAYGNLSHHPGLAVADRQMATDCNIIPRARGAAADTSAANRCCLYHGLERSRPLNRIQARRLYSSGDGDDRQRAVFSGQSAARRRGLLHSS